MGKYKIGARVRDLDGDEGVIVGKRKGERRVQYAGLVGGRAWLNGESVWWHKTSLTPIAEPVDKPAPEPDWQPKVGDRVRLKSVNLVECWGRAGEEGRVLAVEADKTAHVQFEVSGTWWASIRRLEPLPVAAEAQGAVTEPAPLTIQPGKFYRTRDGRKVLVSDNAPDTTYPFYHDYGVGGYHGVTAEGKSCIGSDEDDLVAEWVDEPAAQTGNPAAVAPATATPAFKVGDRVRVKDADTYATVHGFDRGRYTIRYDTGLVGGPIWFEHELEPADTPVSAGTATIRTGTFANLRVKVTSVNGQKANVIIPGLRNPSHGVPLSELSA